MDITPVLSPFVALLKSRAFILMVVTALVNSLVVLVPAFEPLSGQIIDTVNALVLALIVKMGAEDVAAKLGAKRVEPDTPLVNSNAAESTDARSAPHR